MNNMYKIFFVSLFFSCFGVFASDELLEEYDENQASFEDVFPIVSSIILEKLVEQAGDFDEAIENVKNLSFASSSTRRDVARAIEDVSALDYIIAVLCSKHYQHLNVVLNALGDSVITNWLDRREELRGYLKENLRQEELGEEIELQRPVINWKHLVKSFPAFMTYYELPFYAKSKYVQELVDSGRNFYVDMVDKYGRTPLMYAAFQGNIASVESLLQRGAEGDRKDREGLSVWTIAKIMGYEHIADNLASDEKDVEMYDEYVTFMARFFGIDQDVFIQSLYEKKLDLRIKELNETEKNNLFNLSLQDSNIFLIQIVFESGGVNIQHDGGYTALMVAVINNNLEVVQALLEAGANVNLQNDNGRTALMMATNRNNVESLQALLEAGANVNLQNFFGYTALLLLAENRNNVEGVQALLEAGANVDLQHDGGYTALMVAVIKNNLEVVQALLKAGANVNLQNNIGRTALMIAVINNNLEVVQALLEAGANDVNIRSNLDYAALYRNINVVDYLLRGGREIISKGEKLRARAKAYAYTINYYKAQIAMFVLPPVVLLGLNYLLFRDLRSTTDQ